MMLCSKSLSQKLFNHRWMFLRGMLNFLSVGLSRKFWSGENFGPGDQNSGKIGPPGPLFPENVGPAVE